MTASISYVLLALSLVFTAWALYCEPFITQRAKIRVKWAIVAGVASILIGIYGWLF